MGFRTRAREGIRKLKTAVKKHRYDRREHKEGLAGVLPRQEVDISLHANQWIQPDRADAEDACRKVLKRHSHPLRSHPVSPNLLREMSKTGCQGASAPEKSSKKCAKEYTITNSTENNEPQCAPVCLVPFHRALDSGIPNQYMSRRVVTEVIESLGKLGCGHFSDTFAVCGLSAMAYYGFEGRPVHTVNIVCPPEYVGLVYRLAKAHRAFYTLPGDMVRFGVPTSDGLIRRVRIMPLDFGFDKLHRIQAGPANTPILSLPGLLDLKAIDYTTYLPGNWSARAVEHFTNDMFWILREIIKVSPSGPEHRLTPIRAQHVIHDAFWRPFNWHHPNAPEHLIPGLFYRAGLGIPDEIIIPAAAMDRVPAPSHKRDDSGPHGLVSSGWSKTPSDARTQCSESTISRGSVSSSDFTPSAISGMTNTPERRGGLRPMPALRPDRVWWRAPEQ